MDWVIFYLRQVTTFMTDVIPTLSQAQAIKDRGSIPSFCDTADWLTIRKDLLIADFDLRGIFELAEKMPMAESATKLQHILGLS
jgi:hypothetical protein